MAESEPHLRIREFLRHRPERSAFPIRHASDESRLFNRLLRRQPGLASLGFFFVSNSRRTRVVLHVAPVCGDADLAGYALGLGLDLLRVALGQRLGLRRINGELQLPPGAGRLRARLHELGAVRAETQDEHGWRLSLDLAHADAMRIAAHVDGSPLQALLLESDGPP